MKKLKNKITAYHRTTRTASYGFLAAVPLLVAYETLIIATNGHSATMIRVGADIWIKELLWSLGLTQHLSLGIVVLIVGGAIALREKRKKIKIEWHYFYWMFMESLIYSIVFAILIGKAVSTIFPNPSRASALIQQFVSLSAGGTSQDFGLQVALSIGAGLYEELFFRVLLVGGLFLFLDFILAIKERHTYMIAAVVGALIFSAVHYIGVYGDAFAWPSFTFRFLFGLALNALYLNRGFGIAAWSHAIYDVLLTIIILNG